MGWKNHIAIAITNIENLKSECLCFGINNDIFNELWRYIYMQSQYSIENAIGTIKILARAGHWQGFLKNEIEHELKDLIDTGDNEERQVHLDKLLIELGF